MSSAAAGASWLPVQLQAKVLQLGQALLECMLCALCILVLVLARVSGGRGTTGEHKVGGCTVSPCPRVSRCG